MNAVVSSKVLLGVIHLKTVSVCAQGNLANTALHAGDLPVVLPHTVCNTLALPFLEADVAGAKKSFAGWV